MTDFLTLTNGIPNSVAESGGGGGSGGLDTFHTEDFETNGASTFTTGQDVDPDAAGTGTIGGVLSDDTTTELSGTTSLKFTMHATSASSDNDFFIIDTDLVTETKQVNNDMGVSFYYKYDGANGDIKFIALDQDDAVLSSSSDLLEEASTATRFSTSFYIPTGTTGIRYGFQVVTGNSSKVLLIDDIGLSMNPFVYKNLVDTYSYYIAQAGNALTSATSELEYNLGTATIEASGTALFTVANSSGRTEFTASKRITVDVGASHTVTSQYRQSKIVIVKDTTQYIAGSGNYFAGESTSHVSGQFELDAGDSFYFQTAVGNGAAASGDYGTSTDLHRTLITATATTEHVVTPAKSGSEGITYTGYTSKNGSNEVLFATSARDTSSKIITVTNTDHTRYTFNKECNFTATASYSGSSSVTINMNLYNSSDSLILAMKDYSTAGGWVSTPITYVASEGDYIVYTSSAALDNNTNSSFSVTAYPKEATFLAAVPVQKVAYIKEVLATGNSAGTFTSGAWQTRTLNTVEGDSDIVTLTNGTTGTGGTANRFILGAGKYVIESSTPAYSVDGHKSKLYDFTNSADVTTGTVGRSTTGGNAHDRSTINTTVEITASTTFEIRHRCQTTGTTTGFGQQAGFSSEEVYTQVKITKLR